MYGVRITHFDGLYPMVLCGRFGESVDRTTSREYTIRPIPPDSARKSSRCGVLRSTMRAASPISINE
jgi:hypothetical protein